MGITKQEQESLLRLVRQREKVMKADAERRSAELLAKFEQDMAAIHEWDTDEIWAKAWKAGEDAVAEANRVVTARSKELGIPVEFMPSLAIGWHARGQNAWRARQTELRRVAKAEIDARERYAKTELERESLALQTDIIEHTLKSVDATKLLKKMPQLERLMPPIQFKIIERKAEEQKRLGRNQYN